MSSTPSNRLASAATQKSTSKQPLPLEGITVVSLEQAIAAPFCTRQLADLGARVIKIERPGVGDFARAYDTRVKGMASHFIWTNRSKESLALDLKSPDDLAVLMKLLEKTDVLVQNLAPGASDRLGLSYEKLQEKLPSLIVCDISGYGQDGPYRDKKAYDLLIQSEAGMLSTTGSPSAPAKVGISIADISAGMYAYTNILAATMQRGKTGLGSKIDISMLESMAEWMGFPLYYTYDNAPPAKLSGAAHATIYPYGPFECGEGTVMFGIQNEREFANFCQKVLGNGDLASDPRFSTNSARVTNRDGLKKEIDAVFSKLSAAEVIEKLDHSAIANAAVNDMQGVWNHPQLRARNRWTEVDTPAGRIPALLPPGTGEDGVKARMDAVPSVGQHTESIFAELGISR
jgi:crotonobetainyl-CoA:carnitine CoA-transferase CaiB-like acyl-CoA transferase